jgi:hypothetical protein
MVRSLLVRPRWVAVVVLALLAVVVVATGRPAAARSAPAVVTSGDARFEVLSPTLVRTEYAGDGAFSDAATFNAIGRGAFPPPAYTSGTADGWLTITTSALTLRYEVGSGPFSAANLTVDLNAGGTPVTAAPWRRLTCVTGALCEAEDLAYRGLGVATDHSGFGGSGFLAGFTATGAALSAEVTVGSAGTYQFDTRYANATGGDGQTTTRTLTLSVDGGAGRTVSLPATGSWDSWAVAGTALTLGAGRHTVTLARGATDSGNVNVDSVALVTSGAGYPAATARAIPDCRYGTSCEAEAGRAAGSAIVATDHSGYSGGGFVAELNQNAGLTTHLVSVPAAGSYTLLLRYANGTGGDGQYATRTATVTAGGSTRTVSLPVTGGWDSWLTASVPVTLPAGDSDLAVGCPNTDSCHVNLDTVAVAATGAAAPPPHLALGGYRRGLDGVNGDSGAPPTTPGLLYRDGWYLLDDTTSALYDTSTGAVTQRPDHGGQPYQDGYLFGYGHDFAGALSDLATLTGPPELLPEWAYGVWYSEYIDRTAADYENTIVPRFSADGVPLDVLVTDTDFKSPNTWSGWEMDPAKFPDPKGFFDWSAQHGLHNTLNIHPSIATNDPQFAQAQATAKNKLIHGGCASGVGTDCYTFDWGDPDQLAAYLNLHSTLDSQGVDFWWLDWCCDASRSSLPGVTPDAWINQQYAAHTAGGFVLSRAFGSLETGGYSGPAGLPTGPWADKRSTVHFTGDTTSTWGTLKLEVGYTPAEAAATGLSAISHDIGGFNNDGTQTTGAEPGTTKEADDLYARWVQLGTFQPVDRLHGNHSDRLPWQYGPAAQASAEKFLRLRDRLMPYTYQLAQQANRTGVPVTRPMWLAYPEEPQAYATAGSEYLYGPDMLVAPVTTPGTTASTSVWFPPGTTWTDWFTGQTHAGGSTATVTTGLDTMPVFVRAGATVPSPN